MAHEYAEEMAVMVSKTAKKILKEEFGDTEEV